MRSIGYVTPNLLGCVRAVYKLRHAWLIDGGGGVGTIAAACCYEPNTRTLNRVLKLTTLKPTVLQQTMYPHTVQP